MHRLFDAGARVPERSCAARVRAACEDGDGTDFLRGVNPEGQIFDFARNDLNGSEFAGATYSPDGDTLFVNIQTPGITFAITGPFEKGVL
jgi:secreted PhoX family phosphatase